MFGLNEKSTHDAFFSNLDAKKRSFYAFETRNTTNIARNVDFSSRRRTREWCDVKPPLAYASSAGSVSPARSVADSQHATRSNMSAPTNYSAWLLDTDDPVTDTASLLVGVIATLTLSVRIGQYLGEVLARHLHAKKMTAASAPEGFEVSTGKEGGFVRKAKAA